MSPDSDKEEWVLQAPQRGLPSTVNEPRPTIVTSNRFATFSKDLSVTTAGDTQNQAPAVITPTHQEQTQQLNQDQLQQEDNNDDDGDLADQH